MNITSVYADWSVIIPIILELRVLALVAGFALFIHSICMAGYMHEKSPWSIALLVSLNAASGLALFMGGLVGDAPFMLISALVSSATMITMALWLWNKGMHVSKFILQMQNNES